MFTFYLGLAVTVAIVAGSRGRNWLGWFALGAILPVFSLILVLALPNKKKLPVRIQDLADRRPCPFCKELIHTDAIKCRYCQSRVPPAGSGPRQGAGAYPAGGGAINRAELTCDCLDWQTRRQRFAKTDPRRLCTHLAADLSANPKEYPPELRGLLPKIKQHAQANEGYPIMPDFMSGRRSA